MCFPVVPMFRETELTEMAVRLLCTEFSINLGKATDFLAVEKTPFTGWKNLKRDSGCEIALNSMTTCRILGDTDFEMELSRILF